MIAYHCGLLTDTLSRWRAGTSRPAAAGKGKRQGLRVPGKSRMLRKMKNRGNEAKEYLKTKDITFLNAANCAHFARKLIPFLPQKEQKTPYFVKTKLKRTGCMASPEQWQVVGYIKAAPPATSLVNGPWKCARRWCGRLARCRGGVSPPHQVAGRMPAPQQARCLRHSGQGAGGTLLDESALSP